MNLRKRILLILIPVAVVSATLFWLISGIFFSGFLKKQEKHQSELAYNNIQKYISERNRKYLGTVKDWAHWDDTYYFLQQTNSEYPSVNLTNNVFEHLDIDFMVFLNEDHTLFSERFYDHDGESFVSFDSRIMDSLLQIHKSDDISEEFSGIVGLADDYYFIASTYVTDSLYEQPQYGRLVIGRNINEHMLQALEGVSDSNIVSIQTITEHDPSGIAEYDEQADSIAFKAVISAEQHGMPAVVFSVSKPRDFFKSGMKEFSIFIILTVVMVLIVFILLFTVLGRHVSKPLMSLISEVKSIDLSSRELKRIRNSDKGELAFLRNTINSMLEKIELEQNKLRSSEEKLHATLFSVGDGVLAVDRHHNIEFMNPIAEKLTGWLVDEANGKNVDAVFQLISEYTRKKITSPVKQVFETNAIVELANHTLLIAKDGRETPIEDTAAPIRDKHNQTVGCVIVFRDFSEKKEKQKWIEYLSYHDQLSGLYNRRFFEEELKRLDKKRNYPLTFIFADVNGLKTINDAFGHHIGDELIKEVAEVLRAECRADEIISRTGGDEFVLILPKTDSNSADKLAKRIKTIIEKKKIMNINISISFGWDTKLSSDQSVWDVLKNAENYMYKKKMFDKSSRRSLVVKSILDTLKVKSSYEDGHSNRVSKLCESMGTALGLGVDEINELRVAGELHDIGKIAVDESILNDPGELSESSWAQVKSHPEIGYRLLSSSNEFYNIAEYIFAHHERWDGNGYPKGEKGEKINFKARIISITDAYDAMISKRPYRDALSEGIAISELKKNAGKQFDPELTRIFVEKVLGKQWETS